MRTHIQIGFSKSTKKNSCTKIGIVGTQIGHLNPEYQTKKHCCDSLLFENMPKLRKAYTPHRMWRRAQRFNGNIMIFCIIYWLVFTPESTLHGLGSWCHTNTCIQTHVYTCTHVLRLTCTHTFLLSYVYVFTNAWMHICMCKYMHACMLAHTCMHSRPSTCIYMHTWMHACMNP